jgi:ribonuclease III
MEPTPSLLPELPAALLQQALTHSSYAKVHSCPHNERLEFLGDAILGAIIADALYANTPTATEGALTRRRAEIIQGASLANIARRLGVEPHLRHTLDKPTPKAIERLLEQAFESIVGATFLHLGYPATRSAVLSWLQPELSASTTADFNPKGALQEFLQPRISVDQIEYRDSGHTGPDHNRQYTVALYIKGKLTATATAASKKAAQEQAATAALTKLRSR